MTDDADYKNILDPAFNYKPKQVKVREAPPAAPAASLRLPDMVGAMADNIPALREEALRIIRSTMHDPDAESTQLQAAKEMLRIAAEMKPDEEIANVLQILPTRVFCDECKGRIVKFDE